MFNLVHGDCLEKMIDIPDGSIDFIFADLPYGTTKNHWDRPIPLNEYVVVNGKELTQEQYLLYAYSAGIPYQNAINDFRKAKQPGLWTHFKRILKKNGCVALFTQTPFDAEIVGSNPKWLKYEWIIKKTHPTGHLNANRAPMKAHEKILIFYNKTPTYNPQMTQGHAPMHTYTCRSAGSNYGNVKQTSGGGRTDRYPIDVLTFKWDTQNSTLNPTQKPIAIPEYFIKTYTNSGDTVLDCCMGSGSTGVACVRCGRNFIGIEKDDNQFLGAKNRIEQANIFSQGEIFEAQTDGHRFVQSTLEGF